MLKIISSKEYQRLKDIEDKYNLLEGKSWVYSIGGRSQRAKLLRLPKEQLVRIIYLQNNDIKKANKLLNKYLVEKVKE